VMGRSLRVLIFDRSLSNHYTVGLAIGLQRLGADVVIAGPRSSTESFVVPIYPREGITGQKTAKLVETLKGGVHWWRLVRRWQPDVLHFQWSGRPNYAIARASVKLTAAPLVLTVHNPVPRGEKCQSHMVALSDALIVHGPTLRHELLRRWSVRADLVHVVPQGNHDHAITRYDLVAARQRLGLLQDGPVYAFVGQISPRKGLDTLLSAFRLHCERGYPGTLVIAGRRAYDVDTEALRRSTGPYEQRVCWLTGPAQVPAEQLDLVMSAATQAVLPFHEASQSASVIYAMTHGRCVVTTPLGELPSTIGQNGLLVPPGDQHALAAAFEIAVRDPELCDRLGQAAREFVLAELDWSDIATLTLEVYESALRSRGSRARGGYEPPQTEIHAR
jgi:glycosyltransferase involved in cell wall biosynthesis